jgi:hypothetical protein
VGDRASLLGGNEVSKLKLKIALLENILKFYEELTKDSSKLSPIMI